MAARYDVINRRLASPAGTSIKNTRGATKTLKVDTPMSARNDAINRRSVFPVSATPPKSRAAQKKEIVMKSDRLPLVSASSNNAKPISTGHYMDTLSSSSSTTDSKSMSSYSRYNPKKESTNTPSTSSPTVKDIVSVRVPSLKKTLNMG
eukprot:CAMPEP_0172502978 /NCGR_PEP_ID=MMETSP1066-20121228/164697_1 /TAXON_ID=671091 /ORGANISM="Coscinodiscus wailesii, Strain CCMP2513" /LENGTH=148 /DNA_ID=CAMNT_0013278481 /DNA_START=1 /DNA_END=443 /DNA_ORIENTATION=-